MLGRRGNANIMQSLWAGQSSLSFASRTRPTGTADSVPDPLGWVLKSSSTAGDAISGLPQDAHRRSSGRRPAAGWPGISTGPFTAAPGVAHKCAILGAGPHRSYLMVTESPRPCRGTADWGGRQSSGMKAHLFTRSWFGKQNARWPSLPQHQPKAGLSISNFRPHFNVPSSHAKPPNYFFLGASQD